MYWLRVSVAISMEAAEALSAAMLRLSPSGIQTEESGDTVVLTMYLPDTVSIEDVKATLNITIDAVRAQGLETEPGRITVSPITDEDWVENYKKFFRAIRIGRLLIRPSWEDVETMPDEIIVELDPGLAFGTGAHPTTEGCLLFLQEFTAGGETVFDLGTGSGILAIAAVKLGASRVIAIDNDEQAISVAIANARANGVASKIEFEARDFTEIGQVAADILVSNLTAPLITGFLSDIKRKLKGLKLFIASGITSEQKGAFLEALEKNGFTVKKTLVKDEWVTVVSALG